MSPLRFALLRHECPADYRGGPHWDLLLERRPPADARRAAEERRLATWSLSELPPSWPGLLGRPIGAPAPCAKGPQIAATELPDHRAIYLDYEGSLAGELGAVARWTGGPLEWIDLGGDRCAASLGGPALAGRITLVRIRRDRWSLEWTPDPAPDLSGGAEAIASAR